MPNPEVVRQTRQFFEEGLKKSQSTEKLSLEKKCTNFKDDPDKDKCSASDSSSTLSNDEIKDNLYDLLDCSNEYVSEDILEKIREYGTTITSNGGRIVDQHYGQPVLTKVIMDEIKNNEKGCMKCTSCKTYRMKNIKIMRITKKLNLN